MSPAGQSQSDTGGIRRLFAIFASADRDNQTRLIVALGRVAAAHLLQSNKTIGELRQRMQDYNGVPLVVTYHPAYLLRNPWISVNRGKTCAIFAVWRRVK